MEKLDLEYLKPSTAGRYDYFLVPKLLIEHEAFDGIDYGAKLLYGILLNRASLSAKNEADFTDEDGNLFIIYPVEEILKDMRCSKPTGVKILHQLDRIGLIEKRRRGQGKPTIIYVKDFASVDFLKSKPFTSRSQNSLPQEVKDVDFKKSNPFTSRSQHPELPEVKNIDFSYKGISNPDSSNPDLSNPSFPPPAPPGEVAEESKGKETIPPKTFDMDFCRETIRRNTGGGILADRQCPELTELLELAAQLLYNCETKSHIRVSKTNYPASVVKERILSLTDEHIEFVLDCMKNNTTEIKDIQQYLTATLFNAPIRIHNHYAALVNHNLHERDPP